AVEDVAALLDAARQQHAAVDAEQVLTVEARLPHLPQRADGLGFPGDRHSGVTLTTRATIAPWARRPTGSVRNGARCSATGSRSVSTAERHGAGSSSSRTRFRWSARSAAGACCGAAA